ncbi:MAG: hypothetical protein ACYS99_14060 [Planctomycetota bacterium]|jgi:hypothetical protein
MTVKAAGLPLLLFALLLLVLAPVLAQDAPTEPKEPSGDEAPAPKAPEEAPEEDPALQLVDALAKEVEKLRKLEFKEPFTRKVVSPEEVKKLAIEMMKEETPPEEMEGYTRLYARLGFWRSTLDLIQSAAQFLESGAAGLYDPDSKTLYLVKGFSVEGSKPIIFHELVHALEDQYFALGDVKRKYRFHSDGGGAITGVVEGSAQLLTLRYMKANPEAAKAMATDALGKAQEQMRMLMSVPVPLVAGVGFYPYGNGPKFVEEVTGGDVTKIAELYGDEPASTEQVLHPEKYGENGDYPVKVVLPDLAETLPEGWSAGYQDTIGELSVGLLLNEFEGGPPFGKLMRVSTLDQRVVFRGATRRASEGWDGDRVSSYQGPADALGLVWASRWDSPEDAKEFAEAYEAGLPYKWDTLKQAPKTASVTVRGDRVLIVEGFPEELMAKVVEAAWNGVSFVKDDRDPNDKDVSRKAPAAEDAPEKAPEEKKE